MLPAILQKSTLNGALHKGNYVWGGAMNLCWTELCQNINNGPLDLVLKDEHAVAMAKNFNKSPFSLKDLSKDCYYVKSGYGSATQDEINKKCREKFPKKTFDDLKYDLKPTDIISYAYFVKEVQYVTPFEKHMNFYFMGTNVKGFKASSNDQRNTVELLEYKNDDDFMVRLKLKQNNEELYLIMGSQDKLPQEICQLVTADHKIQALHSKDVFEMPVVELDVDRNYEELIGAPVKSGKLQGYFIAVMLEKIKFKIDEVGAKVENEAVMVMKRCAMIAPEKHRNLVFNKPFWVVMKQKGAHPYFVAQISNTEFMMK